MSFAVAKFDMRKLPALARDQIDHAKLPALYVAARESLKKCADIDECKDIADKHSSLAHYAKQLKDQSLLHHANRVYARAFDRLSDLLTEFRKTHTARQAVEHFGITIAQANDASRIAQFPRKVRDAVIENSPPPGSSNSLYYACLNKAMTKDRNRKFSTTELRTHREEDARFVSSAISFLIHNLKPLRSSVDSLLPLEAQRQAKRFIEVVELVDAIEAALTARGKRKAA